MGVERKPDDEEIVDPLDQRAIAISVVDGHEHVCHGPKDSST